MILNMKVEEIANEKNDMFAMREELEFDFRSASEAVSALPFAVLE